MPRSATVHRALRSAPFTLAQARAVGVSRRSLQGPAYRRLAQGIYLSADVPVDSRVWLAAAALRLPAGAAISGLWAARAWGVELIPDGARDVDVTLPRGRAMLRGAGMRIHRAQLAPHDVVIIDGVVVDGARIDGLRVTSELSHLGTAHRLRSGAAGPA